MPSAIRVTTLLKWLLKKPWFKPVAAIFCILGFLGLFVVPASRSDAFLIGNAAILLCCAAILIATLTVSPDLSLNAGWRSWLKPSPASHILLAAVAALESTIALSSVFQPNPLTRKELETELAKMRQDLAKAEAVKVPSRVIAAIPGTWGEPGCAVTYEFAVDGETLSIVYRRRLPGHKPWRAHGRILPGDGNPNHIDVELRAPPGDRGTLAGFTLTGSGPGAQLDWLNGPVGASQPLVPCGERRRRA